MKIAPPMRQLTVGFFGPAPGSIRGPGAFPVVARGAISYTWAFSLENKSDRVGPMQEIAAHDRPRAAFGKKVIRVARSGCEPVFRSPQRDSALRELEVGPGHCSIRAADGRLG